MKKPVINRDECLGDAICEDICPEVFKVGEDDIAYVIEKNLDPSLEEKIQEAIDECPQECISWSDEEI